MAAGATVVVALKDPVAAAVKPLSTYTRYNFVVLVQRIQLGQGQ
jgi:hypothetical protein